MAEVLVVGAGLSGLAAARDLLAAGHDVVVVDARDHPGGRMATHHEGSATWDLGAQFLTAKTAGFRDEVARWQERGVAAVWFHGSPDAPPPAASTRADSRRHHDTMPFRDRLRPAHRTDEDGHPRFRGAPSMRAIPDRLADGVTVRLRVQIEELRHTEGRWTALDDRGAHLAADAVVLTAPAPRALALLGDTSVGSAVTDGLRAITYAPCWAALVRPDGRPDLPDHGALRLDDHPLHFVTDNLRKGVSSEPAVTLHASPARSRELLDHPGDLVGARLLADAAAWVSGQVVRTHRWRWSMPTGEGPDDALATTVPGPLAVAGDGLAGGRVEGAWTSGRAAAAHLLDVL